MSRYSVIPQDIIDEVRAQTNIVEVVGQFVELKRSGSNWKGLCPFHGEKSPSFMVSEPKQIWRCFGCGEGGNVFTFLTKIDNRSFPEVVEELARSLGIEIPQSQVDQGREHSETEQLLATNEAACEFFQKQLAAPVGKPVRDYLDARGIRQETRDKFRIGYCGPGWDAFSKVWRAGRNSVDLAIKAGLLVESNKGHAPYDRFHDRVVFPIDNRSGRVIGFGGRIMGEGEPKYLNSAETPVYRKSGALFGLDIARRAIGKTNRVILVEGYFDVFAMAQAGFEDCVATCGTALTMGHLQVLRRYTDRFVMLYDGDRAGRKAAMKALPLFVQAGLHALVVTLPVKHDPDTFIAEHGADAMAKMLEEAPPLDKFTVLQAARTVKGGINEKVLMARRMATIFREAQDPLARESYAGLIADALGLPGDHVSALMSETRATGSHTASNGDTSAPQRPLGATNPQGRRELGEAIRLRPVARKRMEAEEFLIKLMLGSQNAIVKVSSGRVLEDFSDEHLRTLGHLILSATRNGEHVVETADLLARAVDEEQRSLITTLALEDLSLSSDEVSRVTEDCIRSIQMQTLKARKKELLRALAEAERCGDAGNAQIITQEMVQLHRLEKNLNSSSEA